MKQKLQKITSDSSFVAKILGCLVGIALIFFIFKAILERMSCELQLSFTWDSPMYNAVGQGMLHGLKPYVDLFECKPPGIFFLTAASFKITGEVFLCNIFCFLCLVLIGLAPLISAFLILKNSKFSSNSKFFIYLASLLFGILIMLYSQIRSGQYQVESFGAAFICLYLMMIFNMKTEKLKPYSYKIFLAAFFLMSGIMFKEPFFISAIAVALIFISTLKDFFYKLLLPMLYGGILGTIVLAITGTLVPFITTYLPNMVGNDIFVSASSSSPFLRALLANILLSDVGNFSDGLMMIVLLLAVFLIAAFLYKFKNGESIKRPLFVSTLCLLKGALIIYLVSLSVGLSGKYFNHHYVIAVPFYIALIVFFILKINEFNDTNTGEKKNILNIQGLIAGVVATTIILSSVAFFVLPSYTFDSAHLNANPIMRRDAKYVDSLLFKYGINKYQYIGKNGFIFIGFTKHSPQGPLIVQFPFYFNKDNTWYTQSILSQMEKAEILFVREVDMNILDYEINTIIDKEFTKNPPNDSAKDIKAPRDFEYTIYFRIKK